MKATTVRRAAEIGSLFTAIWALLATPKREDLVECPHCWAKNESSRTTCRNCWKALR